MSNYRLSIEDRRNMGCKFLVVCFRDLTEAVRLSGTYSQSCLRAHAALVAAAGALYWADLITHDECARLQSAANAIAFGETFTEHKAAA